MTYKTGNVVITRDSTLKHHGILGQKWGDRNGPPYPLDASQASAGEKRKGFKESKWAKDNGGEIIIKNRIYKDIKKLTKSAEKNGLTSTRETKKQYDQAKTGYYDEQIQKALKDGKATGVNVTMSDGNTYTKDEYRNQIQKGKTIKDFEFALSFDEDKLNSDEDYFLSKMEDIIDLQEAEETIKELRINPII